MRDSFKYKLYLVTDQRSCLHHDFFKVAEMAVKGGVDLVQIREKDLGQAAFLNKTLRLKELLDRYNVPLIVNDSLAIAQQVQAAGIHVGNSDLSPTAIKELWPQAGIIGYSLEELAQLERSHAKIASYVALSPVFSTATKTDTITEWGFKGITQVRALCTKPLVAIGHIDHQNARAVINAGADCLAVVSAICAAADPQRAAAEIRNEIEKAIQHETI